MPFVIVFSKLSTPRLGEPTITTCAASRVARESAIRVTRAFMSRAFRESSAGVRGAGVGSGGLGRLRTSIKKLSALGVGSR